jgi:L-fucose isomerase-like protein
LDWNNNYGDNADKCILFHCGPVPASLMQGPGRVTDHSILMTTLGQGCSYGCNQGRIAQFPFTFGGMMTQSGKLNLYLGEGRFTNDAIPDNFFGCAGVAEIQGLEDVMLALSRMGHRHHVALTKTIVLEPVREALGYYLGYNVVTVPNASPAFE